MDDRPLCVNYYGHLSGILIDQWVHFWIKSHSVFHNTDSIKCDDEHVEQHPLLDPTMTLPFESGAFSHL